MSQVDPQQIEQLLQEGKIASMSDILAFIAQQVNAIASAQVQQLHERVTELQRPKGMDRVMIEEVKTLVQAMIDQREDNMLRGLDRKLRDNISSFEMQENSRQSLNEVDFANFINRHHGTQSQQLRKPNILLAPMPLPQLSKFDSFQLEIVQLRDEILAKADRREIQELRTAVGNLGKEVVGKVTFQEVQKLIIKFQKDTFLKITEGKGKLDELEARMQRQLEGQQHVWQRELQELSKDKAILSKLQKKMKRQGEHVQQLLVKIDQMDRCTLEMHTQCKQSHGIFIEDMGQLQGLVQRIAEQKEQYLLPKHINNQSDNHIGKGALWMAAPANLKNGSVVWSREIVNQYPQNLQFDSGKSCIRLVGPGFYEITCMIYGGNTKKPPTLICNSQSLIRFEQRNQQGQCISRWQLREWIQIRQSRSQLSIRVQGEDSFSCILLWVSRLSS